MGLEVSADATTKSKAGGWGGHTKVTHIPDGFKCACMCYASVNIPGPSPGVDM